MSTLAQRFIAFSIEENILRFGEYQTKAGRLSPYFFNAGHFNTGRRLERLGNFYAEALFFAMDHDHLPVDMIYGPAYKGIPLGVSVAMSAARLGRDLPWAFNRKEIKDHGEGGQFVGAPLKGNVLIIDDVISAGTSVGESVELIRQAGANPVGVLIALDRQERSGTDTCSAVESVKARFGLPVYSIAKLDDLLGFIEGEGPLAESARPWKEAIRRYRDTYGTP